MLIAMPGKFVRSQLFTIFFQQLFATRKVSTFLQILFLRELEQKML
uniref:Uncharacterized protein n=1 Tax=Arundo donax TaxID=35708 RepID=A0A0A9HZA8_ARUDO